MPEDREIVAHALLRAEPALVPGPPCVESSVYRHLLVAAFILLAPSAAWACRCKEPTEIAGSYARSVAVVRAKVANVTPNPKIDGFNVILQISDVWKTSLPQMVTVGTGTDCRFPFEEGGEYLVVLLKYGNGFTTGRCLGNRPIHEAKRAMEWLNAKGVRGKVQ